MKYRVGDIVSKICFLNRFGVVVSSTKSRINVKGFIDGDVSRYHADELSKDIVPKQHDVFEAMFGSPEYVDKLLLMNPELSRQAVPTQEYMEEWLKQWFNFPYYKSYFMFLHKLNPIPISTWTNVLKCTCTLSDYASSKTYLELLLFLIENDAPADEQVHRKIVDYYRRNYYNQKDRKYLNKLYEDNSIEINLNFNLINAILIKLLDKGMDPFISLESLQIDSKEDERDGKYALFKLSIEYDNYELYDHLVSMQSVVRDPRFEEAKMLPERIREWSKRLLMN